MEFRTEYKAHPAERPIDIRKRILLMGSCFADNIGAQLRDRMLPTCINPAGTLFNPQSIANVIRIAITGEKPSYEEMNGVWNSWLLPSQFSDTDRERALQKGENALSTLRNALKEAETIIITFGTAIVYALTRPPFIVVSNCHKQLPALFFRDLLTPEVITAAWDRIIELIRRDNPKARFIFTVSPVRHLKEGFHANTISKATLHLALSRLTTLHPDCQYFPSYEIMHDDLRDYRFCADDMQHPTPQAVRYIYEKFAETYFTPDDRRLMERARKVNARLSHRIMNPDTPDALKFIADTQTELQNLLAEAPFLSPEQREC